ncbi:MAG: hypothetical protein DWQ01_20810 [Planctomycetota bacterium]|nr:MAG: hypothetical protein DWQ01_20810 [Planctomycetota bacterium]
MKHSRLLVGALGALLLLPACFGQKAPKERPIAETTKAGEGAQAATGNVKAPPPLPDPKPDETQYVNWIRDNSGNPLMGVRCAIMNQKPEALYMREPVRAHVDYEYKTPAHGRFAAAIKSDGKPRYLWVAGRGIEPAIYELPAAAAGQRFEKSVALTVKPVMNLKVVDHQGYNCRNAIVTVKANRRAPNSGNTERANSLGKVTVTRNAGTWFIIANKENGTCRKYMPNFQWDGSPDEIVITLPEKSEKAPAPTGE